MIALQSCLPLLFLLAWSSGAVFAKLGLEDASVSVFLAIRASGALLAVLVLCTLYSGGAGIRSKLSLPVNLLLKTLVTGLLLQVFYQSAYFLALDHGLTPGLLALVLGLQPLLTPLIAGEPIARHRFLFLALGLGGLVLAVIGAKNVSGFTLAGLAFAWVSVIAITLGSVMQKKLSIDPMVSAFYQNLIAASVFITALPLTTVRLDITPTFMMSAAWMILVVSTLAVLLLFYMLSSRSASQVSFLFYLVPLFTIALDYLVFGHSISIVTCIGAFFIIMAMRGFNQT
ncbi:DMT family transporter [Pseudomonas sp. CFBP 8758]|nr:DMT family transporter [Pseudomonas sp. CFBP 8758]MBD8604062.1 DMT family transporter [Pseudomonas sp. CFBP 8771]MBD8732664.1 DMT family transporter [Pseudomonas sp. CFBP 13710]